MRRGQGTEVAKEAGLLPPFRPEDISKYVTRLLFPVPEAIAPVDIGRMKNIVRKTYIALRAA